MQHDKKEQDDNKEDNNQDNMQDNKKDNEEKNLNRKNQELYILKQLTFKEYMKKTNKKPWYFGCCIFWSDCCCCCSCCLFCFVSYSLRCIWPYDYIENFYKNLKNNKKCNDIFISFLSILTLIYNILSLYLSICLHQEIKNLKIIPIEIEHILEYDYSFTINVSTIDDFKFLEDIQHVENDLCYTFSKMEIGVLIINIIIFISFIIFDFLIKCKFHDIIITTEKKIGKITQTIIIILFIFFVLFAIIFFFTFYLFANSIFYYVFFSVELDKYGFMIFKMVIYFFIIVNIYMMFYYFEFLLSLYLDLNFEGYINKKENNSNGGNNINDVANDMDNINDKIKEGYLFIGKRNIPITIKTNKNLYLEEPNKKKIYIFKLIKLNDIKEDYVYIKVKNNAYENMLASSDWIFPGKEKFYEKVYDIVKIIGFFIILYSIPFIFLVNNFNFYHELKGLLKLGYFNIPNIKYKKIFIIYGNYEKSFTIIRLIIYIIVLLIFIAILFKRIICGGYMIYKLLKKANVLLHLLNILNVFIFILHCFLWIFAFIYSAYELFNFQRYFTIFCLLYIIYAFIKINALRKDFVMILIDLDNLEKEEKKENEIKFQGFDSKIYFLKEIKIQGHPRYLYYNFKLKDENNDVTIYNREKDLNDDDLYSISFIK